VFVSSLLTATPRLRQSLLRESDRDVGALRPLLGHSRIDTTQLNTDEIELDELAQALGDA
jgi:site-specific recombinase XerC